MAVHGQGQEFSGAAKVWEDFSTQFPNLIDEETNHADIAATEEFRDEYIRLPYDDVPRAQECRW